MSLVNRIFPNLGTSENALEFSNRIFVVVEPIGFHILDTVTEECGLPNLETADTMFRRKRYIT